MVDAKLIDWVKRHKEKGYSIDQIKEHFKKHGFSDEQIEQVLTGANILPKKSPSPSVIKTEEASTQLVDKHPATKSKDWSRDEDTISHEDFSKLEGEEKKKQPLFKRIMSKDELDNNNLEEAVKGDFTEDYTTLSDKELRKTLSKMKKQVDDLTLEEEKEEGKIELENETIKGENERITALAEEISELRTEILDRERYFNRMESDFVKMQDQISSSEPEKIELHFEKLSNELIKKEAKISKNENNLAYLLDNMKTVKSALASLKNFESMKSTLNDIKIHRKAIEQMKYDMDRKSGKGEILFKQINDSYADIKQNKTSIEKIRSDMLDLSRKFDKIIISLEDESRNKEVNELKKDVHILKSTLFNKQLDRFGRK